MQHEVQRIIEEMGFKMVCNEYVANFLDDASGEIIEVIVKETEDENGLPFTEFHCFSDNGEFLGKYLMDQMIAARAMNFELVPTKSRKTYESVYHVEIGVPVDMTSVMKQTFQGWFEEGYETEEAIAERVARTDLAEWLNNCPFNVRGTEPDYTEVIKEEENHV